MLLLIDNYDSFTYNLVHYFGELGSKVVVHRNNDITVDSALGLKPDGIILSPGPCDPEKAGICLDLLTAAAGICPILGVCLGHQAIGQAFGGVVQRAPVPVHGKLSNIEHDRSGLFKDLPSPFKATRYHSLVIDRESLPDELYITAESSNGIIMGIAHREFEIHGVQFHPESIASEYGHQLLQNFVNLLE